MKVGILTFPNSTSYGATLQMYALYHTVNNLGHKAEIINYHNAYMKAGKHVVPYGAKRSLRDKARFAARAFLHRRLEGNFRNFEKNSMVLFPTRKIVDKRALVFADKRYDAVICGSDQVWNPHITDKDLSFFLDFCTEKTRRISYAPSFGIEEFSEDFGNSIRSELEKFHAISVREQVGGDYVEKLIGRRAEIVTDPTLLVSREEWEAIESKRKREDAYILHFAAKGSKTLLEKCKKLADMTGLKIVVVGGNFIGKMRNRDPRIEYAVDISPSEWLSLVHHAEYVVTNSFHGTAFSIIYRKNFYLELSSLTNSRLLNIVRMLGIENRVIGGEGISEVTAVDYSAAEESLCELRVASLEFLKKALGEEIENG